MSYSILGLLLHLVYCYCKPAFVPGWVEARRWTVVVSEPLPVCEWLPAVVSRGSSAARSEVTFSSKLRLEADTATEGGGQNLGHQWARHTAQNIAV